MGRAYSTDLRRRLIRKVQAGASRRAAAEHFDVAPSTAVRLYARYEESGSIEPEKLGRPLGSGKLGPHRDFILEQVKRTPDITMPELAALLAAERGIKVDPSNISKFLCAAGYSYKKSPSGLGARTRRR
jgi:transposase